MVKHNIKINRLKRGVFNKYLLSSKTKHSQENCENFDDGLIQVAPKGEFKAMNKTPTKMKNDSQEKGHKDNCSCFNCSLDVNAIKVREKMDADTSKIPKENSENFDDDLTQVSKEKFKAIKKILEEIEEDILREVMDKDMCYNGHSTSCLRGKIKKAISLAFQEGQKQERERSSDERKFGREKVLNKEQGYQEIIIKGNFEVSGDIPENMIKQIRFLRLRACYQTPIIIEEFSGGI